MDEEIDIYGDLDQLDEDKSDIVSEAVKQLQEENAELQKKIEELSGELEKTTKYSKSLEANISSLHKTAKVEIARKDRMIADLRQQLDNSAFRRNTNFRIPKRIPRPSVISLPPKDEFTCTEIKKEEVNSTINKGETEYKSPLIFNDNDSDDAENPHQLERIPVTVFGERLKRRLEQESREEAEAAEKLRTAEEQAQQSQTIEKAPEAVVNDDPLKNKEEKENEYRLIPLTLQKFSENLRKRAADSLERTDDSKPPEKPDHHRLKDNHKSKRRKFDESESRREKSPGVERHQNSKSTYQRRMEIEAEYSCPGVPVQNGTPTRLDKPDTHCNSRHQKARSSGSRSRSKSREKRSRRNEGRNCQPSLDRRKIIIRERSKSPSRRYDSEKDKYHSGKKASDDRYGDRRRENSRNSKRPIRKEVSPPVGRMDLRRRLNRKNGNKLNGKIQDDNKYKEEMSKKTRNRVETGRSDKTRKSQELSKNRHVSKTEINDSKHKNLSSIAVDRQREVSRNKNERPKSPSSERRERNSPDEKIIIEERNPSEEIIAENKIEIDFDEIEEGEIPDSPSSSRKSPILLQSPTSEIKLSPWKEGLHPEENAVEPRNLDESLKEEKIENIELFIEKLQSNDKEFFEEPMRKKEQLESLSRRQLVVVKDCKESINGNTRGKVELMSVASEKDTSDESVHLTSILGDSSEEEACEQPLGPTTHISEINVGKKLENTAPDDCKSLKNVMPNDTTQKSEIVEVQRDSNVDKLPEAPLVTRKTPPKEDMTMLSTLNHTKSNESKLPTYAESAKGNDSIEEVLKSSPKLLEVLQAPRPILQEIDSPSKVSVKPNEPHPQKSALKEKENSGAKTDRVIVVARRRRVRLTDISTSMTVVVSAKNTDKNQK